MNNKQIEDLLISGYDGSAQLVNSREIAALIESFGYCDQSAEALGFRDIFAYADSLLSCFQPDPRPVLPSHPGRIALAAELRCALPKFCLSLAYAVPWMALLTLEYLRPDALKVSPELGGALSLSLIASLMLTGGFIQTITRSGTFYYGLKEPVLARQTCLRLLNLGLTCVLVLALVGMTLGFYFHVFGGGYLMMAAINYVALSLLWMFCAVLSAQGRGWCIPLVFLIGGLLSILLKVLTHVGAPSLLMVWPMLAVLSAVGCTLVGFHRAERAWPSTSNSVRPRVGVLAMSLVPFFLYGTVYFSFLFADRLAAGSAIPWVSGLSFGIDPAYKKGMDLVLLAFLVTAALVEYLGDSFLRYWHRLAFDLPQNAGEQLIGSLRLRHRHMLLAIFAVFILIAGVAWFAFSHLGAIAASPRLIETAALGGIGYLLLCMALLEMVILASVNATSLTLAAVSLGLVVNVLTGYGLSHVWGVQYAAAGLVIGSAAVLWKCSAAVRQVLRRPDYYYSVS
ncbi:MAG TPA: hypothetical protein VEI01_17160 [Terriglobales bacterium]|nr:hypothetical protein [Terriglobales bacterium]